MFPTLIKRLFAAAIFLPSLIISAPVILGTLVRYGAPRSWNESKARRDRYWRSWVTRPFMWSHMWLMCNGDRDRQIC